MSAAPYWSLYCSAREAIKEAAAAAGTAPTPEGSSKENDDEATPTQPELEVRLERLVQETHRNSSSSSNQRVDQAPISSASSVVATQEKRPGVSKRARQEHSGPEGSTWDVDGASEAGGGGDKCLGLLAEAFAEDLDDLRKDEHFGGSARDVAAMADIMRCLAGGLDPTEQRLLLGKR